MLLQQRLEHAAERAHRSHGTAAVLFADLDRFKRVNDTHGHTVGDELLIAVARRLSAIIRPGDTLARVSGDEFVFLCEDMVDAGDVEQLATRIQDEFVDPFDLSCGQVSVSASVGVAFAGPGESVSSRLVSEVDTAMYQAKRKGGAVHQVLDLRAAREEDGRESLERDLRSARTRAELDLAYQPIVRTADGVVTGVEALLRWTHPVHGPVPAMTAVSLAERTDLIVEIGRWVLERACRDRVQWLSDHPERPLDLSVNVSVRQLLSPGLSATVAAVLDRTGMAPAALMLEVTEGAFIEDDERAMTVLADLKALGLQLALDDFGTGYSSLSYLQRFPIDMVKIDQSLVTDVEHNYAHAAIAASVTRLAHDLGLGVTAEGVETERQRLEVVAMGCELAQGFLYARPMTALDLAGRLDADDAHLRSGQWGGPSGGRPPVISAAGE